MTILHFNNTKFAWQPIIISEALSCCARSIRSVKTFWPLLLVTTPHSFTPIIWMRILKAMIMFLSCFRLYSEWILCRKIRTTHMWLMLTYSIAAWSCCSSCHMHQISRNQNAKWTVLAYLLSISVHGFFVYDIQIENWQYVN